MKLSDNFRKAISDEFKYAADKMEKETNLGRRNYFFSATYAIVLRILNLEFDPALILVHEVLQNTYRAIDARLTTIATGQEKVITIPEELFDSLAKAVKELGAAIRDNRDLSQPLQKIATVGFATFGNGYYLYQKGILRM